MSKLIKACIALAAFAAFAVVPSIASATNDGILDAPTNTPLAPTHEKPIPIVGKNVGATLMKDAPGGNVLVECTSAELTGHLETNQGTPTSESKVEGTITTAKFESPGHSATNECTGSLGTTLVTPAPLAETGLPWCLRSTAAMKTDEFQLRGGGCTSAARAITFQLHVTSLGLTCNYQRLTNEPIAGTYATHPSAGQASVADVKFERHNSSGFCPAAGYLTMTFNLTSEGKQVYITNHDGK